jgi:hypothetical protein
MRGEEMPHNPLIQTPAPEITFLGHSKRLLTKRLPMDWRYPRLVTREGDGEEMGGGGGGGSISLEQRVNQMDWNWLLARCLPVGWDIMGRVE